MDNNERYQTRKSSPIVPFALGAMIGAVVGAAVALLYAPVEGSELRRGMSDKLEDIVDGAKEILKNAKSSAEKMFSEGMSSEEEEDDTRSKRTRERADDIIENADRAIADARRRSRRHEEDEDEE